MASKKKKKKQTAQQPGAKRMSRRQSMMFLNALIGYCQQNDIGFVTAAEMCEVPLSQISRWYSQSEPFSGTIPEDVRTRFCAAAGLGRDELMGLATVRPFVREVSAEDVDADEMPEYMHRQQERWALNVEDALNTVIEDDDETGEGVPPKSEGDQDKPEVEPAPEAVTVESRPKPVAQPTTTDGLSAFEHAIITLMREHDAARAASPGAADADEYERLVAENEELQQLLDDAHMDITAAESTIDIAQAAIDNLAKTLDDTQKACKRKDNEIARLQKVADEMGAAVSCSASYVRYIEADPLFTKRNLTPTDVYTIASDLWRDRLFFTKTAQKDIRNYHGDAYELLGALRALAVPINDVLHKDEALNADELKLAGGYEIALHESKRTSEDKRCRQERTVAYNGKQVYFEKHLKAGHGSDSLRIHFEFDRDAQCIVIGRCGGHLTTVGGF